MRVTINMDDDLYLELEKLAGVQSRSLSGQAVHLIKNSDEMVGFQEAQKRGLTVTVTKAQAKPSTPRVSG